MKRFRVTIRVTECQNTTFEIEAKELFAEKIAAETAYEMGLDYNEIVSVEEIEEQTAEKIAEKIDFCGLHKQLVLTDNQVWIYEDGSFEVETSGTYPGSESTVVLILNGRNYDTDDSYFEGWGVIQEDEYGDEIFLADDGRRLSKIEAAYEAIEDGDWTEWREEIIEKIENELQLEEERKSFFGE